MHLPEDSARIHNQICVSANVHVDNQGNILTLEDDPAVMQCATCCVVLSNAQ